MSQAEERTEQATDKRMKEVRSKGQLSKSQDLTAWVGVGAAAAMMPTTLQRAADTAREQMVTIRTIIDHPEPGRAVAFLEDAVRSLLTTLGPMLGAVCLAVLLASVAQGGLHFKRFRGEYQQFNLVTGVKRIFGGQALWNGAKALMKTTVIGVVLYAVVQSSMPVLMQAGGLPIAALLGGAGSGVMTLVAWAVAAGLALAFLDVFVVQRRNRKKTRMTKKEVKDEHKNSDGDPLIRSQRRSRQMAMSRNRMIADVAGSDVVVVNPTHVAVALQYVAGVSAPRVVAKGADHVAARIREVAAEHRVPMVRDVPLARALHQVCDVGDEVPSELYLAVARVLAFVMALKRRGAAAGGVRTMNAPAIKPGEWDEHAPRRRRR